MDRRKFLTLTGATALATTGAALLGETASERLAGAATKRKPLGPPRPVTLGFIALTDCASLVMAQELGYFAERNLDVTLQKQASWPATRDALLTGQLDGAHCLFSMPFSVATGIGGKGSTALKIAMTLSNNGQAITLNDSYSSVGYDHLKAAGKALGNKPTTLAMTFPGGTHDTWLRYWLKATKAPTANINIIPVPPPQMVANMKVGTMDGYCVGEPWNAAAVAQGIGFTTLTTQDLWLNHPEKALVVTEQFATGKQAVLEDVMAAVLKASKWLDNFSNRSKAAAILSAPGYVNTPIANILPRLEGHYDLGAGLPPKTYHGNQMVFYRNGAVNFPRRAYAIWFMAQYQRFGLLKAAPNYTKLADEIILTDLYRKVAAKEGIAVPDDDMASFEVLLDHTTFNPNHPEKEVKRA